MIGEEMGLWEIAELILLLTMSTFTTVVLVIITMSCFFNTKSNEDDMSNFKDATYEEIGEYNSYTNKEYDELYIKY